ncbi:ATP-binding cassette domain-containing protein [Actinorugispora endophytica]|uniref:ABC-2 type transport system ATP-binding protein n=1 Tax=Actinorugispora endophytica TaxID=1605990 RepID=A0A4R6UZX7_9ACTN|nr:ATP-binding cassette domain-containing protein [Actinorugispora endophytica]TDQ52965.1 ABC-2 type transport system ATP-binding protein [Actinorugispora endophytica]
MSDHAAIQVSGLEKSFGRTRVLDGIDLSVPTGTVFGLLGPNGAGKTTTVRILSTLVRPDAGRVVVAGFDVVRQADRVRGVISLTGQYAGVDERLTGEENMVMMGRLHHLGRAAARRRGAELLERFDLADARGRLVKTYSGGMRRRLDLAVGLISRPPLLFLDEPTTGLDPRSRQTMWEAVQELSKEGVTVFLTTQYLEEADRLADRVAVIDGGSVIAEGTVEELKASVPGASVELRFAGEEDFRRAVDALDRPADSDIADLTVRIPGDGAPAQVKELLDRMDAAGAAVGQLLLRKPTLDDVFLALTGHSTRNEGENG